MVVGGPQQTLRLRSPIQAAGTVQLGRHDELFERADVGGRHDHGLQLVRVELAARHRHVAAEPLMLSWCSRSRSTMRRALPPQRLDAGVPPLADTVDALDQLGEREDVGRLQVAGQRWVQPGRDESSALRRRATRFSSQRSASSWRAIRRARRRRRSVARPYSAL